MKLWITIAVLVVVLVGGSVFFGLRIVDLSEDISELKVNYTALQTSNNDLQISYNKLETDHTTTINKYTLLDANHKALQSNFNSLDTELQTLTVKYTGLETDYKALQSDYDKIRGQVSALQINNIKLQTENSDLQKLLSEYENVPHSYYSPGSFSQHSNTLEELSEFLTLEFVLPTGYKLNVFDCSESAAYLEWALEISGFDAEILTGPTPWDTTTGYHAWVMVYTTDYQVAIEATALTGEDNLLYLLANRIPGVVYAEDDLIPGWSNYYHGYDNAYQNIYHAIRDHGSTEWNWWEGFFGFQ